MLFFRVWGGGGGAGVFFIFPSHESKVSNIDKNPMISLILSMEATSYKGKQLSLYITEAIQGKQLNHR